jgi:hypothetical protein
MIDKFRLELYVERSSYEDEVLYKILLGKTVYRFSLLLTLFRVYTYNKSQSHIRSDRVVILQTYNIFS